MTRRILGISALALMLAGCGGSSANQVAERQNIFAVGSSTVYPFTKAVAEQFHARHPTLPEPVVQSNGTKAGLVQFCGGIGSNYPDIADASRRMRPVDMQLCQSHGVGPITELRIGIDGLAFVQSSGAPALRLTRRQLYRALAAAPYGKPNAATRWKDIDPAFPDMPIRIYGPPTTSGTRDSLEQMVMTPGCESDAAMRRMKQADEKSFERICTTVRADGVYVESGENDETTAIQLVVNPGAVGIFGYSYLEEQGQKLHAIPIDGILPDAKSIASGKYPGARQLFLYVKNAQADRLPGLKAFLAEYAAAIAPAAYLDRKGLIPASDEVRAETTQLAASLKPVDPAALK